VNSVLTYQEKTCSHCQTPLAANQFVLCADCKRENQKDKYYKRNAQPKIHDALKLFLYGVSNA